MSAALRILDTSLMPSGVNIALTAALAELHRAGQCPDTLRFHLYPPSVLVGRHQVLEQAANLNYCRRNGIEIARRITGGGAVFMGPGVLAWDLVAERRRFGASLGLAAADICNGFAAGLARLGLPARYRPVNAIEVAGRKISGAAGSFDGPTLAYQGTILVTIDIREMTGALAHMAEPVTSVAAFLGRDPTMSEIKAVLTAGVADAWRTNIVHGMLTPQETALADRLFDEKIGTKSYLSGDAGAELAAV
jgi:lipoate-protein ligase A